MVLDNTYYTVKEVAEILKVSEQTVYNWINEKKLKFIKIGDIIRIPKTEIPEASYKQNGDVIS